jgi:hypothetical protein
VYDVVASSALQGVGFGIGYAALGTLAVQHVLGWRRDMLGAWPAGYRAMLGGLAETRGA